MKPTQLFLCMSAFYMPALLHAEVQKTVIFPVSEPVSSSIPKATLDPITVTTPPISSLNQTPPAFVGGDVGSGSDLGILGNQDYMSSTFNQSSFTEQKIEKNQDKSVGDTLLADASVTSTHSKYGIMDTMNIRGFATSENNFGEYALNGMYGVSPNLKVLNDYVERIEVLKGPAAFAYGISPDGSVGGVINVVPKRAKHDPTRTLTLKYGQKSELGIHADIGQRFGTNKEFGARVNLSHSDGKTFIDNQKRKATIGALALDYEGENLRSSIDIISQNEDYEAPQRIIYVYPGFDIPKAPNGTSNVQMPWEFYDVKDSAWNAKAEYDINSNLTVFGGIGGSKMDVDRIFSTPLLTDGDGSLDVYSGYGLFNTDRKAAEAGMRANFDTNNINHQAVIQANYLDQILDISLKNSAKAVSNLHKPVDRPNPNLSAPTEVSRRSDLTFKSIGFSDTIGFNNDRLKILLGGRYQQIDISNMNKGKINEFKQNAFSPVAGVNYSVNSNISVFTNYAEGLSPGDTAPDTAENAGETLEPYISKQYELGAKIDFGNIGGSASLFQIKKPFGVIEEKSGRQYFVEGGEQTNKGIEASVFGKVNDDLSLLGSVAFIDAKLSQTQNPVAKGNQAIGTPKTTLSFGADWNVPYIEGLSVGGTYTHTGSAYVNQENTQSIPAWNKLDLRASYKDKLSSIPVTYSLNVNNVTDEEYWSGVASYRTLSYGEPRNIMLAVKAEF
ncbi:TonB-dependent receptor [Psychrobacter pygoscelis]|uniref:TonB-dependent receptor n=1 Tax=Psychrobacter pygoscelis TaxID=2488563 RepID=UPI00103CB04D|nr:TonB-dependent siderophore receptor [Psychrobacter pygoscelis]